VTALRIPPQSWMTASATRAVFEKLQSGGAQARFVGGCVRDLLIGRAVNDIDIATDAEPTRVMEIMKEAGFKTVPIGLDHGTVLVVVGAATFEVTTLRHDVETDGRHAKVEFTTDWVADAARRDFTFNALSLEMDGALHDSFGGAADLKQGRVRFVGDAATRIDEDVLRLLRYYRFFAHFGRPPADLAARAACRERAPDIERLSAERIRAEFLKLLAAPNPCSVLDMMRDDGVLSHVIGHAGDLEGVARLVDVEMKIGSIDPVRRLFALSPRDIKGVREIARRLKLSNADRDFLLELQRGAGVFRRDMTASEIQREVYRFGSSCARELALMAWAQDGSAGEAPDRTWREILAIIDVAPTHTLPVTGADILLEGVKPGTLVGNLLRRIELWWIEGDFKADRSACLQYLKRLVARTEN
jgi:poly(A) polymerase